MKSSLKCILLWFGAGLLILILGSVIFILFASDHFLRQVAGEKGSAKLGRGLSIDGPIKINWDWAKPEVHLSGLHITNIGGSKDPNMVQIDNIDFHIKIWKLLEGQLNLPDITITRPIIILEKFDPQTKNWDFPAVSQANVATHAALPTHRGNFPIIDQLTIIDGKLTYRDKTKDVDVTLDISTASGGGGDEGAFTLNGKGALQNKTFIMHAQGGSLAMLRNGGEKYPLHLHVEMGTTIADVDGTFDDPVKMEGIDTKLDLRGDSMANLFYLTLIPLPPTPTYQLSGHLLKKGDLWTFENFKGKVGNSDLEGNLDYDISKDRGFMKAALTSKLLDMKDLAGFTGATPAPRPGEKTSATQIAKAQKEKASPRLLPDMPLDLSRLRATDMDVTLKAEKILAPGVPMDNMNVRFNLRDGVLRIDPLEFGIASGKIGGSLVLDGTKNIPHAETDLSITHMKLKQFFAGTQFEPLSAGLIGGNFHLVGDGKSVAEVLGASDGHVGFVMSGGTISQLLVDAAGLDIGKAAPILLGNDKATAIRCAVADFGVTNGLLESKVFVFDTTISNIAGTAHVNLKDESIDVKIEAEPKSPTITAHAPIIVTGVLKHPSVSVDLKETTGRAAGAAILSVFLTPIAAIIPFIETGVGKDSDCGALIAQAKGQASLPAAKP